MLLDELLEFAGGGLLPGSEVVDGRLLSGEVAADDQGRRDQVHLILPPTDDQIRRLLDLLLLILDDPAGLRPCDPPLGGDEIDVVLHPPGPVIHQALVGVVLIQQWQAGEPHDHILRERTNDLPRFCAGIERPKTRLVRRPPLVKDGGDPGHVGRKLRVGEDGRLHLRRLDLRLQVPGPTVRPEQRIPQRREDRPVALQGVDVPARDAAA
ncbi:hypothetical protein DSECCO2_589140 [anaerobic digester metagenome]